MYHITYFIFPIQDYGILKFMIFEIQNSTNGTQIIILGDILMENISCYDSKN